MLNGIFEIEDLLLRAAFVAPAIVAGYLSIKTSRTPQGAMGWIVLILAYPFVGVPAYAIFGWANYAKFAERRRASDARIGEFRIDPRDEPADPDDRLSVFARLSGSQIAEGCDMDLLVDGEETFDAIEAAISKAEHYILIQFYTFEDDKIGRRIQDACIERANAGVPVYFLHDEMPLLGLPARFMRKMHAAGIRTARPKGPRRALGAFQWNYRNHRKLVVVDGTEALTGGLNCSKTYIGESSYGPWRDTFARFEGPVVDQLERSFAADWVWATGEDIRPMFRPAPKSGDMRAVALPIAPTDELNTGNLYFIALAQQARKRLWIATPYFVPDSQVMAALQLAALRGVDLRLLIPDNPDHILPWWAAFSYFDELRAAGGEIYRYTPAFMHQKVALMDDDVASVGSVNLDIRSGLLNFELTVIAESPEAARETETMLLRDFENSYRLDTPLSGQPALRRILARVSRLAAPQL